DVNGNLLKEEHILGKLKDKRNWISEISLARKILQPFEKIMKPKIAKFVNIMKGQFFYTNDKKVFFKDQKSKFFYNILEYHNKERMYTKDKWKIDFKFHINWKMYFNNKIIAIVDKKVAYFNFKLFHNVLPSSIDLFKWKKADPKICNFCKVENNLKHIIIECDQIKDLWIYISSKLKIKISWKNIVIGNNIIFKRSHENVIDLIISTFAYNSYKSWLISKEKNNPRLWRNTLYYSIAHLCIYEKSTYEIKNIKLYIQKLKE
ncbi:unnamed protein product, partial [Owenia fusiformis]